MTDAARFLSIVALLVACSGPQHRKVAGPPPEYEVPEAPDASAWTPVPAAPQARDAGGP